MSNQDYLPSRNCLTENFGVKQVYHSCRPLIYKKKVLTKTVALHFIFQPNIQAFSVHVFTFTIFKCWQSMCKIVLAPCMLVLYNLKLKVTQCTEPTICLHTMRCTKSLNKNEPVVLMDV